MTDWNALISDVVAGKWKDPSTARPPSSPSRPSASRKTSMAAKPTAGAAEAWQATCRGLRHQYGRRHGPPGGQASQVLGTIEEIVLPPRSNAMNRPSHWCRRRPARRCHRRGWLRRPVGHLQVCDLQGRSQIRDLRHGRLDERVCGVHRFGHARQRLQDIASGPCAARHLLDLKVSAAAPHWLSARAWATRCAAPPRRSSGGPRTGSLTPSTRRCPTN